MYLNLCLYIYIYIYIYIYLHTNTNTHTHKSASIQELCQKASDTQAARKQLLQLLTR